MSNLRDVSNNTNRTLLDLSNKHHAEQAQDAPIADVEEMIALLTARRVRLREWIYWARSFYNNSKYDSFATLLESAIIQCDKSYPEDNEDLLRTYTLLIANLVSRLCCDPGQRGSQCLDKVEDLMQAMDNISIVSNEVQHLLVRGFGLLVLETRLQEADDLFIAVLRQVPHNVLALVGRACLAYNREEYRVALGFLKDVLLYHPHGPADVRVGIAHCFMKLGDTDRARRTFELALLYNGRCLNALLGMAQLKFNERQRPSNMEAVNMLSAAFDLNEHHPLVLSWLAGYFYYTRNYEQVMTSAGNAYRSTDNVQLKAQNCYQIARSFHAMHNYDKAFDFYGEADTLCDTDYAPIHMGLAQIYAHRGQLESAEHSLCTFLQLMPSQPQALRMLATLYAQVDSDSNLDTAIEIFEKELDTTANDDYDLWLGLARAYERKQLWQQALNSYEHAVDIFQRMNNGSSQIPLAWLNNMALAQMHDDQPQAALQTLNTALSMDFDESQENDKLTLLFNRARVLEQLRLMDEAEYSYGQLINNYPNYYDSYLRLAAMCYNRNQVSIAMEYLRAVLNLDGNNAAARTYMGHYYTRKGELTKAMHHYNKIMRRSVNSENSSIRVAIGNLYLRKMEKARAKGDHETAEEHQKSALHMFKKILKRNEGDMWALNGLGVTLCNFGQFDEAEMIFKKILESHKQCRVALLNLGHIALESGRYAEAIGLYTQCLREIPFANSVQVMQLLARSLCHDGRIKEAKDWLLKARHVAPQDMKLLYNLAVIIKQESSNAFALKHEYIQLAELQRAKGELKLAQSFFQFLEDNVAGLDLACEQATECSRLLGNQQEELNRALESESQEIDLEICVVEPVGTTKELDEPPEFEESAIEEISSLRKETKCKRKHKSKERKQKKDKDKKRNSK